jgi:hypothetical protein
MKKHLLLVGALFAVCLIECSAIKKGIVVVPVADLVGDPISRLFPNHSPDYSYSNLPWSCYQGHYGANARLHQLLLHEQVTIVCSTKHEVCVEIPQVFYTTRTVTAPQIRYWTLKKNIMPLSATVEKLIPPAVDFHNPQSAYTPNVAHLLEPWHVKELDLTFSAGTRFCIHSHTSKNNTIPLYALNPTTHSMKLIHIPRTLLHIQNSSHSQRITDFITVCQRWARTPKGDIAYTLGGCSYVQAHESKQFSRSKCPLTQRSFYRYNRPNEHPTKTGLDCSNLILRAAQIAGLPYFYKNTHTVEQNLRSLAVNEPIESGDIVWMPGHVLIISDAQKGLCVEAHSYDGGYGIVHELPLEKVFKGITSSSTLAHAAHSGKTFYRLHKNGKVQQVYTNVKILKLRSLFK